MGVRILDLSAYAGLAAVGLATVNLGLGTLIAARYSPLQNWPRRRINLFDWHHRSGWVLLGLCVLHPALLLWVKQPRFGWRQLLFPPHSPGQPLYNTIGALALYILALVFITSQIRRRLGRRLWKAFHYAAYAALAGLFLHGLLANPEAKNAPANLLDGGKLWVEGSLLAAIGMLLWGLRRRWMRKRIPRNNSNPTPANFKT